MTHRDPGRVAASVALVSVVLTGLLGGCGRAQPASPAGGVPSACPVTPLQITVSVDPWTDMVTRLAGACGTVTTILAGSAGDPHEYEPTPGDAAAIVGARLVVVNGAGYDTWASKLVATVAPAPAVLDGGAVVGAAEGSNPHLWYSPTYLGEISRAVTAELVTLAPGAASYFTRAAGRWSTELMPYTEQVASLSSVAAGRTYGATEGVFDLMADALGMRDATPPGWANAAANEGDPSPGDILAFQTALSDGTIGVLVVNVQTEGAAPAAVRSIAESSGVPVVEVTETMSPGVDSFVAWQVGQLQQLADAMGA